MSKAETKEKLEKEARSDRIDVHEAGFFKVVQDKIHYDNRKSKTFDLILHPGGVAIIAIDENNQVLLVRQWRRAAGQIMIELPAGTLENGEDPLDCAGRELREETGFRATKISPIGGFYSLPGICNEYLHLFYAHGLTPSPLVGDDTDEIDLLKLPIETALEMVRSGEIIDAKTVAGLLWYNQWIKQ